MEEEMRRRIKELNKRGVEAVGVCVYLSKDVERQIYRGYGDGEYKTVVNELKKLRSQKIDVQEEEPQTLGISPAITIPGPLVVAGISALSAVIGSLLSYLATSKSGEIVITGSSGRNITIPKDTPKEDIDFYRSLTSNFFREHIQSKSLIQIHHLLWDLRDHGTPIHLKVVDLAVFE